MTSPAAQTPAAVRASRPPLRESAFSDAIIGAAAIAGAMVGGGKDPVAGFYSTVIPLAVVAMFLEPWIARRLGMRDESIREPQPTAVLHAAARALAVGLTIFALLWIGWRDQVVWGGPAMFGVFSGVRGYWGARKLPHVRRVTVILAAIILVVFVIVPAILRRVS
jgi:hypothetical protein